MKKAKAKSITERSAGEVGRAGILTSAARLFSRQGFDSTSISDLAREVGLSKATIYHYFADKNQIYLDLIQTTLKDLCQATEEAVVGRPTATAKFIAYAEAHARFFETNRETYIATTLGFGGLQQPLARHQVIAWRDRHEKNLRAIVSEGIASGEFQAVDPRIASTALLSCLNWMVRWYRPEGRQSAVQLARQFSELLVAGLLPGAQHVPTVKNARG
jgi:AcrR family transcriptional regulator